MNVVEYTNTSEKFMVVTKQLMEVLMSNSRAKLIDPDVIVKMNYLVWPMLLKKTERSKLYEYKFYAYGKPQIFYVIDSDIGKFVFNDLHTDCVEPYFYMFNKTNGYTVRFGKLATDDPKMCLLGPEILDLEISVNGCPKINGKNCKFCYKNNTDAEPENMDIETFRNIIKKFPKNLSQIAFGITGTQTNPWFPAILKACKEEFGIIPNYTLSGVDLTNEMLKYTVKYCGAVAVSCYEGAKEICYDTIKRFNDYDPKFHTNMHIVLSKGTYNHVMDVLNDIKAGKVSGLKSVVFLRIKPVGRAAKMNVAIPSKMLGEIITFCETNNISFGFDSCSATNVIKWYESQNRGDMVKYCEPCESSMFSSYINVNGMYHHCSFCESLPGYTGVNVNECNHFTDIWLGNEIENYRNPVERCSDSCAYFNLD